MRSLDWLVCWCVTFKHHQIFGLAGLLVCSLIITFGVNARDMINFETGLKFGQSFQRGLMKYLSWRHVLLGDKGKL